MPDSPRRCVPLQTRRAPIAPAYCSISIQVKGLDLKPLDRVQPVQQQLTVYMIAARCLKAMDLNGTSDPYMTLEVAETRSGGAKEGFWVGKGVKAKTAVKKNTLNPIWRGESMRSYARVMHAERVCLSSSHEMQ